MAGTGGFLSEGDEYIQSISDKVTVSLHGQELNPESYAICKADMLIKGQGVTNINLGTLAGDQLAENRFEPRRARIFPIDTFGYRRIITSRISITIA